MELANNTLTAYFTNAANYNHPRVCQ